VEQESSGGGGGVDALFEHDQVDAAFVECGGEFGHVSRRPERPRQPGDHQFVAATQMAKAFIPFRAAREFA